MSMDTSFYFTYPAYHFKGQVRNIVTLACEFLVTYPCGTTDSEINSVLNAFISYSHSFLITQ